jgi:uncharacterized protein (TIGR02117 family)
MRTLALGLLLVGLGAACAATGRAPAPVEPATITLHVVNHGWHTGIVLRRADLPAGAWPASADFPHAESLEVGWGDRDYYPARDPGIGTALDALLLPTPGVLHVVGFSGPVQAYFPASEIVTLRVTRAGLAALATYFQASHERDQAGRLVTLGPGLYGDSRFYGSVERFHLFSTCNAWTARALRAAGLPVGSSLTAGGLMAEARRVAEATAAPDAAR